MPESLRQRLLSMARRDLDKRERLAGDRGLFDGYHLEMQAVHEENAAILERIVEEHGWPTATLVGTTGRKPPG